MLAVSLLKPLLTRQISSFPLPNIVNIKGKEKFQLILN